MNDSIKNITAKGDEKHPGELTESSNMPAEQKAATGHSARQSEEEKRVLLLLAIIYRLLDKISSLSISYKIAGILVIILLLTVISLGFVTFSRQKNMLEQELRSRAQVLVQQLANVGKEGLLTGQELPVFTTIADIQQNAGVVYAMVIDAKKNIFVHNVLNKKGMQMEDAVSLRSLQADSLFFQNTEYNGEPVIDATLPIITKAKNLRIGTARVGISVKALNKAVHQQKLMFIRISLAFTATGVLISLALARFLTKPIIMLAEGMKNVSRGDVSMQINVRYKDEIGKLTIIFNQMILSLREKFHMEKYLSDSTVRSIRKHRDLANLKLGGEKKYVTALFSDIRGFTAMSEKMTPEDVVTHLNLYLNLQYKVIHQWGGVVDKFVGDEVMAIFEGEEIKAIRAAVEIQRYCDALNVARAAAGEKQIHIGIGLNNGNVIMGNIGSEDHMDYTVIGDAINIAARLCSVARGGQIVISNSVADKVRDLSTLNKLEPIMVKGKAKPLEIHEVVDVTGAARMAMRRLMDAAVEYQLEGLAEYKGHAVAKNLSSSGCLIEVPAPIGIGSRLTLKIDFQSLGTVTVEAIVHHTKIMGNRYQIGVNFLNIPETLRYKIIEWIHQVESET